MSRQKRLDKLLTKLKEKEIHDIREELEDFLGEDIDSYTKKLQEAIDEKLEGVRFCHQSFEGFLRDYQKNNPSDPAGYHSLRSSIYGEV